MSGKPWFHFYIADWRADSAVRMCSPLARCLWLEMVLIMQESDPVGFLLVKGRPVTTKELARLAALDSSEVTAAMTELEENGVFSRVPSDPHGNPTGIPAGIPAGMFDGIAAGTIYGRKPLRDAVKAAKQSERSRKRWGAEKAGEIGEGDPAGISAGNAVGNAGGTAAGNPPESRIQNLSLSLGDKVDFARVILEAGDALADPPKTPAAAPLEALLRGESPCDLEADIYPAIAAAARWHLESGGGAGSMKTWTLAARLAVEYRDKRAAGAPPMGGVNHDERPTRRAGGRSGNTRQSRAAAQIASLARVAGVQDDGGAGG